MRDFSSAEYGTPNSIGEVAAESPNEAVKKILSSLLVNGFNEWAPGDEAGEFFVRAPDGRCKRVLIDLGAFATN